MSPQSWSHQAQRAGRTGQRGTTHPMVTTSKARLSSRPLTTTPTALGFFASLEKPVVASSTRAASTSGMTSRSFYRAHRQRRPSSEASGGSRLLGSDVAVRAL